MSISSVLESKLTRYSAVILAAVAAAMASAALFASAVEGPEINLSIRNTSNVSLSEASLQSVVHARASVASSTSSTTPTGDVDFKLYANTSCSGTPTTENVDLSSGVAESATTSVGASGLSYRVIYNGDSNNAPSESSCVSLTALAPSVSIGTTLSSTTIRVGTAVHANATLNNETANATGTVTYRVYSNQSCTANMQSAGTKDVTNGDAPTSNNITFNTPGTYYWQAVYSGDQFNSAATSSCTSGKLRVFATSTPIKDDNGGKHDRDEDEDEDHDNGKHKGFVEGLPFGIWKKLFSEDFRVPPGILKKFDAQIQTFLNTHDENEDAPKHQNKGKGSEHKNGKDENED